MNKLPLFLSLFLSASLVQAQEPEFCPLSEILPNLPKKDLSNLLAAEHCFIMFGAEWCAPCRRVHPLFDNLKDIAQENNIPSNYLSFDYIDIDLFSTDYEFLEECINGIPAIVETDNGQEVRRYSPHQIEELGQHIRQLIDAYRQ